MAVPILQDLSLIRLKGTKTGAAAVDLTGMMVTGGGAPTSWSLVAQSYASPGQFSAPSTGLCPSPLADGLAVGTYTWFVTASNASGASNMVILTITVPATEGWTVCTQAEVSAIIGSGGVSKAPTINNKKLQLARGSTDFAVLDSTSGSGLTLSKWRTDGGAVRCTVEQEDYDNPCVISRITMDRCKGIDMVSLRVRGQRFNAGSTSATSQASQKAWELKNLSFSSSSPDFSDCRLLDTYGPCGVDGVGGDNPTDPNAAAHGIAALYFNVANGLVFGCEVHGFTAYWVANGVFQNTGETSLFNVTFTKDVIIRYYTQNALRINDCAEGSNHSYLAKMAFLSPMTDPTLTGIHADGIQVTNSQNCRHLYIRDYVYANADGDHSSQGVFTRPQTTYSAWGGTLNASDKNAHVALSGGNLIATVSGANDCAVRGTQSHVNSSSQAKYSFKMTPTTLAGQSIGIATATASIADGVTVGTVAGSYGWASDGNVYNGSGTPVANYGTYTTGDEILITVDINNKKLWWAKNGTWVNGDPVAGSGGLSIAFGTYYPAVSADTGGVTSTDFSQDWESPPSYLNITIDAYLFVGRSVHALTLDGANATHQINVGQFTFIRQVSGKYGVSDSQTDQTPPGFYPQARISAHSDPRYVNLSHGVSHQNISDSTTGLTLTDVIQLGSNPDISAYFPNASWICSSSLEATVEDPAVNTVQNYTGVDDIDWTGSDAHVLSVLASAFSPDPDGPLVLTDGTVIGYYLPDGTVNGPGVVYNAVPPTTISMNALPTGTTDQPVTVTLTLDQPATQAVAITMAASGVSGSWSANPVTISQGSITVDAVFTPTSAGTLHITETNNRSLTNAAALDITVSAPSTPTSYSLALDNSVIAVGASVIVSALLDRAATAAVTITLAKSAGLHGNFSAGTIVIGIGETAGQVTFTSTAPGTGTISATDNRGLTDPAAQPLAVIGGGPRIRFRL